ncbi:TIGR03943 family protein [Actinoplanes sp. NPDC051851]|uniref:TIGR03943 family putative permease subunit n=1 Tax=Actinoplanes sp. NPDC051851 TaxID=3154753 RepID=UPI00342516C6
MARTAQALVLVMLGAVLIRISATGEYLNYVRPGLGPYLAVAGVFFLVLGAIGLVRDFRAQDEARRAAAARRAWARTRTHGPGAVTTPATPAAHDHGHGHDEWYGHGSGWLLCVPLFLLLVLPPPALGSYAAGRAGASAPEPAAGATYATLPTATTLTVRDYAIRAVWDEGRTLSGHRITLTGFADTTATDTWYLTRMHVTCCAADAQAAKVEVLGSPTRFARGQWVTVTGTWLASDPDDLNGTVARIQVAEIRATDQPTNPYE